MWMNLKSITWSLEGCIWFCFVWICVSGRFSWWADSVLICWCSGIFDHVCEYLFVGLLIHCFGFIAILYVFGMMHLWLIGMQIQVWFVGGRDRVVKRILHCSHNFLLVWIHACSDLDCKSMVWVLSARLPCVFLLFLLVCLVGSLCKWYVCLIRGSRKVRCLVVCGVSQVFLFFSEVDQMGHRLSVIGLL